MYEFFKCLSEKLENINTKLKQNGKKDKNWVQNLFNWLYVLKKTL